MVGQCLYALQHALEQGDIESIEDAEAQVLGQVVYSQGRCEAGMGVKDFGDWRSVYVAAPNIPAPVLRGITRYAGVHLHSEAGDVLYAIRQLLAVHTLSGGPRRFRLPAPVETVFDLFERRVVAEDADAFEVDLAPRSTNLYYTGSSAPLASLEMDD